MTVIRGGIELEWLKRRAQHKRKPRYLTRRQRIRRARHR